jgi:hypothetical protein
MHWNLEFTDSPLDSHPRLHLKSAAMPKLSAGWEPDDLSALNGTDAVSNVHQPTVPVALSAAEKVTRDDCLLSSSF